MNASFCMVSNKQAYALVFRERQIKIIFENMITRYEGIHSSSVI